jgi:hypothetical protein
MAQNTLPQQAFDGQLFIDAFRVKWQFDGKAKCWRNIGTCPEIPVATELQPGLLSAKLKRILDGIPVGGGHFGIIAQPLLTLKKDPKALIKDEIDQISRVQSGTRIRGKVVDGRRYSPEQYVGKVLMFLSGILAKKVFLIFTNDEEFLFLEGDATAAEKGDKFQIVESTAFNPSGVLLGDILLVSDSIDITCVDGKGLPVAGGNACNVDVIQCDSVENPPGLNFQINKDLLDSLCVTVPGCKGPVGDRGAKGADGADGTGDGPVGEQGDPGEDAPAVANTFTGIKIIDVDDIWDTAVVAMELDAEAGKLNVIRAKVRTPDNDTPATQVISTPVNRSVDFNDSTSFDYTLMKPSVDPIGTADIDILKYPNQFSQENQGQETNLNRIKLSEIIDAIIAYYEDKLSEINDQYNQDLKAYIEEKDAKARELLAALAQNVAECEFELPIKFCLGIQPNDCHPDDVPPNQTPFIFPFAEIFFGTQGGQVTALPVGETVLCPTGNFIPVTFPQTEIPDAFAGEPNLTDIIPDPNQTFVSTGSNMVELPAGSYAISYVDGAFTGGEGWMVGSELVGEGITIRTEDGLTGAISDTNFPVASQPHNINDPASVIAGYNLSDATARGVGVELPNGGKISMMAAVNGSQLQGGVKVRIDKVNTDC